MKIGQINRENPVIAHILDKGREIMILDYSLKNLNAVLIINFSLKYLIY